MCIKKLKFIFDDILTLKCPYYAIVKVPNVVFEFSYNWFTCIRGRTLLTFFNNINFSISSFFSQSLIRLNQGLSLSKPLISKSLLYLDWSDDPVCCDWSTLLGLVR